MKLNDEQKEEIEAELWGLFGNADPREQDCSRMVKFIKEIAAPAIFKILEREEAE